MKKSTLMSSRDSTINKEDRIINRDMLDPYRFEKRLLKVYDYESNKDKYNLNSFAMENSMKIANNFDDKEKRLSSNRSLNEPQKNSEKEILNNFNKGQSEINNFNRIKDYIKEGKNKYDNNLMMDNHNQLQNNRRNVSLEHVSPLQNNEEHKYNSKLNQYNYKNHLEVFNSLSNFSDSNDKNINFNDSKLTEYSRSNKSPNSKNNHFLNNPNTYNLNNNIQTYDEHLNKYKRHFLDTNSTSSIDSNVKNLNDNKINKIENYNKNKWEFEKKNYIKINESSEVPPLNNPNEEKRILILKNENYNNIREFPSSNNLMGTNTTKLHKKIEMEIKDYDNMSRLMKDQIGNYNSKLNEISKNLVNGNLNTDKNKNVINSQIKNIHQQNREQDIRFNNSKEDVNLSELNSNFNKKNYETITPNRNIKRDESNEYKSLNKYTPKGAYEKINYYDYKTYNHDYSNHLNQKNSDSKFNYLKNLTINTLENTISNNTFDDKNYKIEDLEKNIYQLKSRIENNLKNRDIKLDKFKEEKVFNNLNNNNNNYSYINKNQNDKILNNRFNYNFDGDQNNKINKIVNKDNQSNINTISNNSFDTNLLRQEKEQIDRINTTQQMNILTNSSEENNKNNMITNYLDQYKDNIQKEKFKYENCLKSKEPEENKFINNSEKKKEQDYRNYSTNNAKESEFENYKENVNSNNFAKDFIGIDDDPQKNERKKVLDMIKDCKKEIEYYKQKISQQDKEENNSSPDFGGKDKLLANQQNAKNSEVKIPKVNLVRDSNSYNDIKLYPGKHKTNFTLGREQDFNSNEYINSNNSNKNNNSIAQKRSYNKSADRYSDSKFPEISVNETFSTNIKKYPYDYSSNINLTLDSVSNRSINANKNDNKKNNNKTSSVKDKSMESKNNVKKPIVTKESDKSPKKNQKNIVNLKSIPIGEKKIASKIKIVPKKSINNFSDKKSNNKRSNTLSRQKTITNSSNNDKRSNKGLQKESEKVIYTTISSIPQNKKVKNLDILSNLNEVSMIDENLENEIQKKEILLKENEILKQKIKHLEAKIEYLSNNNKNLLSNTQQDENVDDLMKNNLIMELQVWKNRSEKMTENYIHTLNDIRGQLNKDKKHYVELIKNMQNEFNGEVERIKKAYEGNVNKNEKIIKKLKKENEDITKKLGKVKDIIAVSQNNNASKK